MLLSSSQLFVIVEISHYGLKLDVKLCFNEREAPPEEYLHNIFAPLKSPATLHFRGGLTKRQGTCNLFVVNIPFKALLL
jgi:hypothetical protein